MKYEIVQIYKGQIEGEETKLITMIQLCRNCRLSAIDVLEFINEGVIEPVLVKGKSIRFKHNAIDRAKKAIRLKNDLELNLAGVSLALQLIDRIEMLEKKLKLNAMV